MAKPIFLVGFPLHADNESVYHVQADLSEKLEGEYHVIAYKVPDINAVTFEVLNAINATDIEIEELISKTKAHIEEVLKETEEFLQAFNQSEATDETQE